MLEEGMLFPQFSLPSSQGDTVSDYSLGGDWAVVYFYPKDDTPGCTIEANAFSRLAPEFAALRIAVYGVSPDSIESHCAFTAGQKLTIPLLADTERVLSTACGAYGIKKSYGKEVMGIIRSTFLIDPFGKIRKVWKSVTVEGHAEKVLAMAKALKE